MKSICEVCFPPLEVVPGNEIEPTYQVRLGLWKAIWDLVMFLVPETNTREEYQVSSNLFDEIYQKDCQKTIFPTLLSIKGVAFFQGTEK